MLAAAYGVHWFNDHVRYVSTDDAYVEAQLAEIAPQIDGTVAWVAVHDTANVKRGDLLVRLDPADARLAVEQAAANVDQAMRHVQSALASANAAQANVTARQSDLDRAALDLKRRDALLKSGAVSGDEVSAARNAYENAHSALAYAQQALAAQRAMVPSNEIAQNPEVRARPGGARPGQARPQPHGNPQPPGRGGGAEPCADRPAGAGRAALMSVVPVREAYVNANFKEVQLGRIRPRPARGADLGPLWRRRDLSWAGRGVSGGTGAAFAVIPAQNATGNWIKVVQRLPVRIALDAGELAKRPLQVGLSMTVTVDLDPFTADSKVAPRPRPAKPAARKKPEAQIALGNFVIDARAGAEPLETVVVTPKADFSRFAFVSSTVTAKAEPQTPGLRTVVNY